jgi:hypothetical protein
LDANHHLGETQAGRDELNLNKSIAAEQSELAKRRNELLISREVAE